ncbi:MAG: FAD-binding oxidoreductase [Pseudomonadota bacterium]
MSNKQSSMQRVLAAWHDLLGAERILAGKEATLRYGSNTVAIEQALPAALRPERREQLPELVRIANQFRIPIYPVSTGNNWGYGNRITPVPGAVLVDLGDLNRILQLDPESGLVTLEPGVTQGQLDTYLHQQGLDFMVPVTGAGPSCSLIGNALDRGYGLTPYSDHFGAVMALEAVLPSGEIYRSALTEMGGAAVDQAYKWGIGPYIDGLFPQGGYGIVTQMTIALAPRPECVESFFFSVAQDDQLEQTLEVLRRILHGAGSVTGYISVMNPIRALSMLAPSPYKELPAGSTVPPELEARLAKQYRARAWTGVGAIYGKPEMVKAARRLIRRELRGCAVTTTFLTESRIRLLKGLLTPLKFQPFRRLLSLIEVLEESIHFTNGHPSEVALPLAYWKTGRDPRAGDGLDPARDGCGIIWYTPLVPLDGSRARDYVEMVKRVCLQHGFDPMINLTSFSPYCLNSTIPILFDPADPQESQRAHACYRALFQAGRELGFIPYRIGSQSMDLFTGEETPFWRLATSIKQALDPNGILAPGRYSLADSVKEESTIDTVVNK